MSLNLQIKKTYSFDVHPVVVLGNNFKNVTVLAIMDHETANKEIDTTALHINVYPHLPGGTPNNPASYNYVKIRTQSGEVTILGEAWINEATVVELTSTTITAKIGNVSAGDVTRIRAALVANGFNSLEITVS